MRNALPVGSLRPLVCILMVLVCLTGGESRPDQPEKVAGDDRNSALPKKAGQVRDDNGLKMKFVWCPPGSFTMEYLEVITVFTKKRADETYDPEDPDSDPDDARKIRSVKVELTVGYWLGECEVRQSEWTEVMHMEPWSGQRQTEKGADISATFVSWVDAMDFCAKLTEQERPGRSPFNGLGIHASHGGT